jgi:hypothetical protein
MCRSRIESGLGIQDIRVPNYIITEVAAQIHRRPQVNLSAAEQAAQFLFHVGQTKETDTLLGLEFDKDVDVTFSGEPVSEDRTEKAQLPNAVTAAEVSHLGFRDCHLN